MIDVSEHLTERVNAARLKLELRRAIRPLIVLGIGALGGLGCAWYIIDHVRGGIGPTRDVRFEAEDVRGVVPGRAEVRFKGVHVGRVEKVDANGERPIITADIEKDVGPIYRDARAVVRPNTPLQDMYVDIVDRGDRRAGELGSAPLPASQVETSVNIAEVLNVFDPRVRARMTSLLRDLGGGLDGRGDALRNAFVELVPTLQVAGDVARELAARERTVRRLVHNSAVLTNELGRRERRLRALVSDGSTAVAALADRGGASLDATLRELPPTLGQIDTSFASLRGVLGDVDAAVHALGPVAGRLPQALGDLRTLSDKAAPTLAALRTPVRRLRPLARSLRPLAADLTDIAQTLRPQVGAFDHATKTLAGCTLGLYGFFQWTASVMKLEDARGVYPLGDFAFGADDTQFARDPNVFPSRSCAPGAPKGATP